VLTTELIEGVPVIEVMTAVREGNASYLESLRAHGYDLDRVVRNLDWNMLNQVYVYGYFHADLHPANLFILPGNSIGYVDYGIVGQLPERVRESLTYYGWLLFRGDVEAAVAELMRWLAPTPVSDATDARRRLIRVHQTFLYDTAGSAASSGFGPRRDGRRLSANPYSRLAVDIMRIVRENELAISNSLVAYLKMLVTLGTIRHQLAVEYDLSITVRRFFTRLLRGQGATWLDPRRALDRAYTGVVQLRRAVEFVEFLEAQEPVITEAVNSLFGLRRRVRRARRRLVSLGVSVLFVGAALYFVLSDPDGTRRVLPEGVSYSWVHGALVVMLLVLVGTLVLHMRQFGQED
jgi:predicted unusual protein kinase regulating ubiquinone biosynthesis (AarF/ABC1/UbiB family)